MKPVVVVFGEKPGVLERIRELGFEPFLVVCLEDARSRAQLFIDPDDAAFGRFDKTRFNEVPLDRVIGIVPVYEDLVEIAAKFRETFFPAFPGLDASQALKVRDKIAMKTALVEAGIPTARFMALDTSTTWETVKAKVGAPALVKPRRQGGACGIRVLQTEADWLEWKRVEGGVENFYAEAFIEGIREFCCDTLVANSQIQAQFPGEYTVDCLKSNHERTGFGVNFPGFASESETMKMKELAARFIQHLQLRDGFCHIEFLKQGNEIFFGEIGVRIPGGLQIQTESLQSNSDILDWYLKLHIPSLRESLPKIGTPTGWVGYYLYPKFPGKVVEIQSDLKRDWIVESEVKVKVGDEVDAFNESVSNVGHCIFRGESMEDLKAKGLEVRDLLYVLQD